MDNLRGQTAVITGACSGIGKGCALALAARGANIVVADIDRAAGPGVVEEIESLGVRARFIPCDVSDPAQVAAMVDETVGTFGVIEILVNNAGLTTDPTYVFDMTDEEWSKLMRVHLDGAFYCTRSVSRGMKDHRYGRIVNVSSLAALLGLTGQVHYATVKAGLVGFTYGVAKELAQFGITVNAVQPGLIRSNLTGPVLAILGDSLADETPISRIGEPSDVAGAVAFLVSPDSGFITGTVVKVTGAYELASGLDRFMHGAIGASHVTPAATA